MFTVEVHHEDVEQTQIKVLFGPLEDLCGHLEGDLASAKGVASVTRDSLDPKVQ